MFDFIMGLTAAVLFLSSIVYTLGIKGLVPK